jgi:hypothetical protein
MIQNGEGVPNAESTDVTDTHFIVPMMVNIAARVHDNNSRNFANESYYCAYNFVATLKMLH